MRKDIPSELYWKLRAYAFEMALGDERRAHLARLQKSLESRKNLVNELGMAMQTCDMALKGAVDSCAAKFDELKAEIGGEIGMEGKPEEWHVQLDGEADSFMEKKE